MEVKNFYLGNYRRLAIVPLILIFLSIIFIPRIPLGIDFKGGMMITLHLTENVDSTYIKQAFLESKITPQKTAVTDTTIGRIAEIELEPDQKVTTAAAEHSEFSSLYYEVTKLKGYLISINTSNTTDPAKVAQYQQEYNSKLKQLNERADKIFSMAGLNNRSADYTEMNLLKKDVDTAFGLIRHEYQERIDKTISQKVKYDSISVDVVSPTLAQHFIEKAMFAVGVSVLMSLLLTLIVFKNLTSSLIVLSGAVADVVISMGAMGVLGVPLTLASFAALLTMIGFSLNTDMLLCMKVMKMQEGGPRERAFTAFKTASVMGITDFIAFVILTLLGIFASIPTYYEIGAVISIGLVGDIICTWLLNAVLAIWYVERVSHRT